MIPKGLVAQARAFSDAGEYVKAIQVLRDVRVPAGSLGFLLYDDLQPLTRLLDDICYEDATIEQVNAAFDKLATWERSEPDVNEPAGVPHGG